MKMKLKTNCPIARLFGLFDYGRVVRCAIAAALCAVGLSAFAAEPTPLLVPDYNRDGWLNLRPKGDEAKDEGEEKENEWNHSAFREVAFCHTSRFYTSLAAIGKQRVIIDTDLGSSMDDLFTVDLAARMHKAGKLDLMAVMIDRPDGCDPDGKGEFLTFADRYLASLGLGDLPIGKAMSPEKDAVPKYVFNPYWTLIYSNNVTGVGQLLPTNRTPEQIASLTNAVSLYRRLLDEAPDESLVICSTGFLTNLKALMESGEDYEGDGIASTGLELIAKKVKELRIMGGCFDYTIAPDGKDGAEYNFAGDPAAAKMVVEGWPTPVVLSTWEVGLKLEYKPKDVLEDFPAGTFDPVIRSTYHYWPEPLKVEDINRLWDVMTVLPLTEGETLAPLSEKGGISVDEKGKTTFTPDASSNRCYQVASNMNATAVMNRIREICRTGNPLLAVRNVRSQQRYPWNGLVDVTCDLTGDGTVKLGVTVLTNGVKFVEKPTIEGETMVDLDAAGGATNGVKFIWNAAADLPTGFKAGGVQVKVTAER